MCETDYLSVKVYIPVALKEFLLESGRDSDLCTAASPVPKHLLELSMYSIKISFVVCHSCFIHVVSLKHKYSQLIEGNQDKLYGGWNISRTVHNLLFPNLICMMQCGVLYLNCKCVGLNNHSSSPISMSYSLEFVNVTLCGKRTLQMWLTEDLEIIWIYFEMIAL